MFEENGTKAATPLLPSVTELVMTSGIVIWVRPLSINDQTLIREEMDRLYPLPKEREFQIPVPEDQQTIPGQTMVDTAAFKEATNAVWTKREIYWKKAHALACVDFPEGTDAIVARYLPEIERKRKFLALPKDDLEAVLLHAVITTPNDHQQIFEALMKTLPVGVPEVTRELRIFRPATERGVDHPVSNGRKAASRASVVKKGSR